MSLPLEPQRDGARLLGLVDYRDQAPLPRLAGWPIAGGAAQLGDGAAPHAVLVWLEKEAIEALVAPAHQHQLPGDVTFLAPLAVQIVTVQIHGQVDVPPRTQPTVHTNVLPIAAA